MSYAHLIDKLSELALDKLDPLRKSLNKAKRIANTYKSVSLHDNVDKPLSLETHPVQTSSIYKNLCDKTQSTKLSNIRLNKKVLSAPQVRTSTNTNSRHSRFTAKHSNLWKSLAGFEAIF